jgi:hypothetical protein
MKNKLFFLFLSLFFQIEIKYFAQILPDSILVCNQTSYTISPQNAGALNVWTKQGENEIIISQDLTVTSSGWYHLYTANPGEGSDISICNVFNSSNSYTSSLNIPSGYMITQIQNALWGTPNTNCANPTASSCNLEVSNIISRSLIGHRNKVFYSGNFPDPCTGTNKYLFLKLTCTPYISDSIYVSIINTSPIDIQDYSVTNDEPIEISIPELICDTTYLTIDSLNLPLNNTTILSQPLTAGNIYRLKVKNAVSYGGGSGNQADGAYSNFPTSPIANIKWRFNGTEPGTMTGFRPEPDGYNPNHVYYFFIMGDGNPQSFAAYDCCLGDNSGFYTIIIEEVHVNSNCGKSFTWSNGQVGTTSFVTPSNSINSIYVSDGTASCIVDSFSVININSNNNNEQHNTNSQNLVPAAISYQAVARDAEGQPLSNTNLQVRFTLLTDSLSGANEYVETHALNTNAFGLFNTVFGAGTPIMNTFDSINWTVSNKYLKVEIDAGVGFVEMGTQQLLSVPFAIRSNTAAKAGTIENSNLPVYSSNTQALAGGLQPGQLYRTATGDLKVVY